jgi:hypothetical protein
VTFAKGSVPGGPSEFAFPTGRPYLSAMPTPLKKIRPKKPTAAKPRAWRVKILRNRSQYISDVQAANEKAAEAAAIGQFNLDDEQRKRLVVRERD